MSLPIDEHVPEMPGACLNSWQTNCEWSAGYVWRSWDYVQRGMFIALALMLAYTVFVVIRFHYRDYLVRRESQDLNSEPANFRRAESEFLADLIPAVSMLRGIAVAAPFLGLAGASYSTLAALWFGDYAGSEDGFFAFIILRISTAFTMTVSGSLVSIAASSSYNVFRSHLEALSKKLSLKTTRQTNDMGSFHFAHALRLRPRFSALPPYPVLAILVLLGVVCLYITLEPYEMPMGLSVALPSTSCDAWRRPTDVPDRIIVLRITNTGGVFLNLEAEDWTNLGLRLSEIYRLRKNRVLYLQAEDDVPFQTVANAIDIARNSTPAGTDESELKVFLLTPEAVAESEKCILKPTRATVLRK